MLKVARKAVQHNVDLLTFCNCHDRRKKGSFLRIKYPFPRYTKVLYQKIDPLLVFNGSEYLGGLISYRDPGN